MAKLEEVFGVSKDQVLSYYERKNVDGAFQDALLSDKQVIVYGSSKQGKTALVDKHLPYESNIVVRLTPKMTLIDIYRSILEDIGYEVTTQKTDGSSKTKEYSSSVEISSNFLIGKASGNIETHNTDSHSTTILSKKIELNLELANDVAKAIKRTGVDKKIILENFHYLNDDIQKQLAFDLRSFQEAGVRFIILGVWREKNRLAQFNGDLLDRVIEVPVEPWSAEEFKEVIKIGSKHLNIQITDEIIEEITANAFDSIGVVQELIKIICRQNSIFNTQLKIVPIDDKSYLEQAKREKFQDYSARHLRALENIAGGRRSTYQTKTGQTPLFLAYYTVRAFLESNFEDIINGVRRESLEAKIKAIHHRPDGIKAADMSGLLYGFSALQSEKGITPPIFDYDQGSNTMRVIDSTFYFFLRNMDRDKVLTQLNNPLDSHRIK